MLLVEDDPDVAAYTGMVLRRLAGARVLDAASTDAALAVLAAEDVDVVVTDIDLLPGADGLEHTAHAVTMLTLSGGEHGGAGAPARSSRPSRPPSSGRSSVYLHSAEDTHQDHRAGLVAVRNVPTVLCFQSPSATVAYRPGRFQRRHRVHRRQAGGARLPPQPVRGLVHGPRAVLGPLRPHPTPRVAGSRARYHRKGSLILVCLA